jgi:hypothetical protein
LADREQAPVRRIWAVISRRGGQTSRFLRTWGACRLAEFAVRIVGDTVGVYDASRRHTGGTMSRSRIAVMICVSALAGTVSVAAHHSIQAQFDINKSFTITGNVAKVEWINPHSYLTLNVKAADGTLEKWAFEMGAAGQLRRTGLSRADRGGLKNGDAVTIKALAARDGSNSGLLQEITTADGRVFKLRPDGTEAQ